MKATTRYLVATALLAALAVACSSDDSGKGEAIEDLAVTFTATDHPAAGVAEMAATGPAVDEGLVCAEATLTSIRFENPDGSELSEAELTQRNQGTESHSFVAINEFACVDESGSFTFRVANEIEDPAVFEITVTGWDYEGGDGYEGVAGEGLNDESTITFDPMLITNINSGVLRGG